MDTYDKTSHVVSRAVTQQFSSSFSLASRLFPVPTRQAIYDIYGLVRVADEIVDSYRGQDSRQSIDDFETETYSALERGFSSNLVIHAFVLSAKPVGIGRELLQPFFDSMRQDIDNSYTPAAYQAYIYGSAEVVGLMCLKVFCDADSQLYDKLQPGAKALGAAFQKINFLRDLAEDQQQLGRYYFPVGSYPDFDEATKQTIIKDIQSDLQAARPAIKQLSPTARPAVTAAYNYYNILLKDITATPAERLKTQRLRLAGYRKIIILGQTVATSLFSR